jgi:hypothetical protein
MVACVDCNQAIGRRATTCPRCGARQSGMADPFVLGSFAVALCILMFMSPLQFPLAFAAASALWLIGITRAWSTVQVGGLLLSALTFFLLLAALNNHSEAQRSIKQRIDAIPTPF